MKQTTRDYTKVLVQIQFIYSNQIFWYKRNIYIQNEHRYKSSEVYTYIYRKKVVKIDLSQNTKYTFYLLIIFLFIYSFVYQPYGH